MVAAVVAVVDHVAAVVVPAVAAVVGHASKIGECNQGCSLFRPDFFLPSLVFYVKFLLDGMVAAGRYGVGKKSVRLASR